MKAVLRPFKKKQHSSSQDVPAIVSPFPFDSLSPPPMSSSSFTNSETNLPGKNPAVLGEQDVVGGIDTPWASTKPTHLKPGHRPPPLQIDNSPFISKMDRKARAGVTCTQDPFSPRYPSLIGGACSNASLPDLKGGWQGFTTDARVNPQDFNPSYHSRNVSVESTVSADFSVMDALPVSLASDLVASSPEDSGSDQVQDSPHLSEFPLSLFPAPPSLSLERGQCPHSMHSISPSPTFPPSPSSVSYGSASSIPTMPHGLTSPSYAPHHPHHFNYNINNNIPLSPTTSTLPVNSEARKARLAHLPLRAARSAMTLRSPSAVSHKVTSSGSIAYSLAQEEPIRWGKSSAPTSPLASSFAGNPALVPPTIQFGYAM